ncbi:uncharacterized protein [Aegilops tauschii subsp. strangulata]|uniref:uncharacterized protein n=1 Tax=Aegilops tauschii subsp. strangulata TaxID=200361 RepID=UPI003CC866FF
MACCSLQRPASSSSRDAAPSPPPAAPVLELARRPVASPCLACSGHGHVAPRLCLRATRRSPARSSPPRQALSVDLCDKRLHYLPVAAPASSHRAVPVLFPAGSAPPSWFPAPRTSPASPSSPRRPGSPSGSTSCPAGLPPHAGSKPRCRRFSPSPSCSPASPGAPPTIAPYTALLLPLDHRDRSSEEPRVQLHNEQQVPLRRCSTTWICQVFLRIHQVDYTARPVPGPSIFSENFAKYHDIQSPGYTKTVPDNVKYLYRRPRTSTKTCTTTVAEDPRNGTVKFNYLRVPLLPSTILNRSENARFEASVSFRSCEDSFDYIRLTSSWTRSSSLRDLRQDDHPSKSLLSLLASSPSLLLIQRRSAIPTSSRARPGARPPYSRVAMPGLLRPWPRRPAPLPPRHSSEPREFFPAAPSPLHRPPRPAPPLPPRRCACLLSSRRPRPLSGRIRSAVVVPGAPDLPCFAKFAVPPWVSVRVDLLPRRSTSPRRQQASLPPLFTKSQLLPCVAGSSSNCCPVYRVAAATGSPRPILRGTPCSTTQ